MTDIFDTYDNNDEFSFQSNPNLKRCGVMFSMTKEQTRELVKCKRDPVYFAEKYVKFITLDRGVSNVTLYPWQHDLLNSFHNNRYTIVKIPRQSGKTATTAAYVLHYALFNKEKTIGILAHKEKVAKEILIRIKIAYENLPMWLQQGVRKWNEKSIELENSSRIIIESTSANALRSYAINLLVLDEFGIVAPHIQDEFWTSVWPTVTAGKTSKVIITSTPKGLNLFYRLWMDAIKQHTDPDNWNSFNAFEIHWTDVPGRDQKWADEQRRNLRDKFEQEVECEFIGSAGTLIAGKFLRSMAYVQPLEIALDESMYVYARPITGHAYALVADPAEGKEQDSSTFTVFDITEAPYTVAAVFRNNTIDALMYAYAIQQAAQHWNNAYVMVENNAIGALVLQHVLYDMDYDNIFYSMASSHNEITVSQLGSAKIPGIRTTKKVKHQGCMRLKNLIETEQIIVQDYATIQELNVFVKQKNNTFAAEENFNDDLVANLWLFAWLTAQPFFTDISDLKLRERLNAHREQMMSNYMPAAPAVVSLNYQVMPNLQTDQGGDLWIPMDVSFDDALLSLQRYSRGNESRDDRLYGDPFFSPGRKNFDDEVDEKRGKARPYPWNSN